MTASLRTLCYGDNLPFLRRMDKPVDLIYLDPPFNSKRAYNIIYPGEKAQAIAFVDTWHWSPECDSLLGEIEKENADAGAILRAFARALGKVQLCAYMVNIAVRLVWLHRILKPGGSLYLHCDPAANAYLRVVLDAIFGADNFRNEIVWHYTGGGRSKRYFSRKHDTIFLYGKGKDCVFNLDAMRIPYKETSGYAKGGITAKSGRHYAPHPAGTPVDDVWDIPIINPLSKERLGYPTQKPLELLERIVLASSKPGDIVLDPFCGCGTATHAAEKHKRRWIGIDIAYAAIGVIRERFRRADLADIWKKVKVVGEPRTVAEVENKTLASEALRARKEFEIFCVSRIGGVPNARLGADRGRDGFVRIWEDLRAVVSVKSGQVGVRDIRELAGLLNSREPVGIFISKQKPADSMYDFARRAGVWENPTLAGGRIARLQILTLDDILAGKKPVLR